MIIDFNDIPETRILGFKGGEGELRTHNYVDDNIKIMKSVLTPGASSGDHPHEVNCEVIYILKGVMTFYYDGEKEWAEAGQVHYCPKGHKHHFVNETTENVEYLAIVPELR
ncbi:cupin domain-containing protein [Prevotella sp. A2931]|uniref:Cupin domain-containing protein n=1 Tax=Prevotella illustrans TaxID=2800387 RepID=A0ABS3M2R9_9BACT|nr:MULTISPECIES: cupin domain-containing protein [Prevotella]MBO1362425.1 cupin domain-containing protein [Prevotella illustrans]PTL25062.1 cupin domain-containing protein [Prevotella sp. oral taxon 820]